MAQPIKREKPTFIGYDLSDQGVPTFHYKLGDTQYAETILPNDRQYSFVINQDSEKSTIQGKLISKHQGFDRNLKN